MYLNIEQLQISLKELNPVHPFFGISFLAFKQLELPVDKLRRVDIANTEQAILEAYYNPVEKSKYYYIPLRSTGPVQRWVNKKKYPDSGLQKTRTTTFSPAFLHPTKNDWGWASDYITRLVTLQHKVKIPAFHLAAWMLRGKDWPSDTQPQDVIDFFFESFFITEEEKETLFDVSFPSSLLPVPLLQKEAITWKNLRPIVGNPPDASPDEGGGLEYLELVGVGPAKRLRIEFAPRLNIITGDNGLGKTFLLECAWWALSGNWADPDQPAYPRSDSTRPTIGFKISGDSSSNRTVPFNRQAQLWQLSDSKRPVLPGLVIYARVDGSCTIWDPAKHYWSIDIDRARGLETPDAIRLSQNQIWDGLPIEQRGGRKQFVCNGLISDWITWQYMPTTNAFEIFSRVLKRLSPHPNEMILEPSTPIKLSRDDRQMPRLKLPYDDVPVILLSAGIRRILSLAYLLVWTWETHKEASENIGRPPQSKIVFVIDEMEAHLHPQWQRVIVPALLDVIKVLEETLEIQLIIATHSPLVMASVEPIFNEKIDSIFTLDLVNGDLDLKELPYVKHGSVNSWLMSDMFDLKRAYSVEAEEALVAAKEQQLSDNPNRERIQEISDLLIKHLPEIDPFWPRWKFFAEAHGVSL